MNTILAQDTALESRIEWRNLPESWQVFVFLAGVLALLGYVLWSYLKEIKQLPLWARWTLTGIRCSVIILLIVLYLDPVKTDYREIQRRPTVAVLSDLSQSMSQRDRWTDEPLAQRVAETMKVPLEDVHRGEMQRLDVLKTILLGEEGLAERLRQKAHVRLLTFGRGVDTVTTLPTSSSNDESKLGPSENLEPEPSNDGNDSENRGGLQSLDALASEWKANRSESDLVEALQSSLNINQLQAIYLLTDGQHTAVTQPVEVARRARELGIPIYTVGIGDPSRPNNVSVKSTSVLEKARPN
ncbi:MAG: vWA domain-containing protein, partial [Planctomycetota bacterium]|nr:vWA domain-containing protein [Planctomycetota bacterium]